MPGPSYYSRIARLSSIIFVLPSSMAAGWLIGRFVFDRFFSTYPWGTIVLTLAGAGIGFYEIFRILAVDQRSKDEPR